jgi:hypothetical protein
LAIGEAASNQQGGEDIGWLHIAWRRHECPVVEPRAFGPVTTTEARPAILWNGLGKFIGATLAMRAPQRLIFRNG